MKKHLLIFNFSKKKIRIAGKQQVTEFFRALKFDAPIRNVFNTTWYQILLSEQEKNFFMHTKKRASLKNFWRLLLNVQQSPNVMENQSGQALVTLLFFVILAIIIVSAAVAIVLTNALSGSRMQEGFNAYSIAESGAENALLRLDRNLNYTGEILPVDGGTATITATGTNPVTILSIGSANGAIKKIQVIVNINNGQLSIVSWKEVY